MTMDRESGGLVVLVFVAVIVAGVSTGNIVYNRIKSVERKISILSNEIELIRLQYERIGKERDHGN